MASATREQSGDSTTPPAQREKLATFLDLPPELRNNIYTLALPTSETDTPLRLSFSKHKIRRTSLRNRHIRLQPGPPITWYPPPYPAPCPPPSYPVPYTPTTPHRPTTTSTNERALHIPALLRTHPLVTAEASGYIYLSKHIDIDIEATDLDNFVYWATRILSPCHAGMLFSNPGVKLHLLSHFTPRDMETVVSFLATRVSAALEWDIGVQVTRCGGCKLHLKLQNWIEEEEGLARWCGGGEGGGMGMARQGRRKIAILRKVRGALGKAW